MIKEQLRREPKTALKPFFSARVMTRLRERALLAMRVYWGIGLVVSAVLAWQAELFTLLACGVVLLTLLPAGWRRVFFQ
jgi:hypothetical protein